MKKLSNYLKFMKKDEMVDDLSDKNIIKIDSDTMNKSSIPVENFRGVLNYICTDVERSIKLTTFMKKEMTQIFGKHNTTFKGEFFYYVWIVEFEGEIFNIATANGKGTQFSVVVRGIDDDKSKLCINFLRKIEELLDGGSINQL